MIEEAAADREISRYVTDLTVDPQELASLLREAIDGLTVQTFENAEHQEKIPQRPLVNDDDPVQAAILRRQPCASFHESRCRKGGKC